MYRLLVISPNFDLYPYKQLVNDSVTVVEHNQSQYSDTIIRNYTTTVKYKQLDIKITQILIKYYITCYITKQ